MKLKINNLCNFSKGHSNHLWYGGTVATIEIDSGIYSLDSVGEVRCKLYAKKDFIDSEGIEYKSGDLIVSLVDKNNEGLFKKCMENYIKDDEHLEKILSLEDEQFELELGNSNCLELSFIDNDGNINYSHPLDTENIFNAIYDTIVTIKDEILNNIHSQDVIYCRSANYSNPAIDNQKLYCLSSMLINEQSFDEIDIPIFVDNGFSSASDYPPVLKILLEEIKNNQIKNVIVSSADRITRDVSKVVEIRDLLNSSNADFYLVSEKMKLNKDYLKQLELDKISKYLIPLEENKNEFDIEEEEEYEY